VTLSVAAGALALGTAAPAGAGGVPTRDCPQGSRTDIASGSGYPAQPAHVAAGFYALIGSYWPPSTMITCKAPLDPSKPLVKPAGRGCPRGAVAFQIPNMTPATYADTTPATWGTFLPPGWYYTAATRVTDWATVCWYSTKPPPAPAPGAPALAPGTPVPAPGTPALAPGTPVPAPGTPALAPGTPVPAPGTTPS
jgi:hypothetical protein